MVLKILLLFLSIIFLQAEECQDWFDDLKINPNNPSCEGLCTVGKTDMGSFECPLLCAKFCKPKKYCKLNSYWTKKLSNPADPFKNFNKQDLSDVRRALSRLPNSFNPSKLKGIVKGTKPVDFTALITEATSTDEFVVLYPRAFNNPKILDRVIAHEVVHVLVQEEWKGLFESYKKDVGWNTNKGYEDRKGEFIEADSKMSADEDFANNIEYYLFEPNKLKSKSSQIHNWIQKKMGNKLKLEKGCSNE